MPEERKCVINYKRGWVTAMLCYGDAFDGLETCCNDFEQMFFGSGNNKRANFGDSNFFNAGPSGLNLLHRGGELKLLVGEKPIQYCPWCAAEIEIKKSKDVWLTKKLRQVHDGYQEGPMPGAKAASSSQ